MWFEGDCLPKTAIVRTRIYPQTRTHRNQLRAPRAARAAMLANARQPACQAWQLRDDSGMNRGRAFACRDLAAIRAATLASFAPGELLNLYERIGVLG